eukprot:gene9493-10485_t
MRLLATAFIITVQLICLSKAFWWPFSSSSSEGEKKPGTDAAVTSLQNVFAPFEVTEIETKFLAEATHYLGNLPRLDQCNLLIINRLKRSCNKMTEADVSKLSVNLLNCQSAVEGRKVFKCTDEMTLSECTKEMDPDTWNAYHVVSNRARAVCYSVRQTEFRVSTEITINSLAHSARDNLASLKQLMEGQDDLTNKTSETLNQVIDGNEKFMQVQSELNAQQKTLKEAISDNIHSLTREKKMISLRQEVMAKHSKDVRSDLGKFHYLMLYLLIIAVLNVSLAAEIKKHHSMRKDQDKELLGHVEAIQHRAKDVLEKLDLAVKNMDSHYDRIEKRHGKIIDNVQDIQKAINFISEVIVNFEETFQNHMRWINDTVGGTRDKLSVITLLLGHIVHFFVLLVTVIFFGSPVITRATLLLLMPLNCITALQNKKHFAHKELTLIIALTYPVNWLCCILINAYVKHGQSLFSYNRIVTFVKGFYAKFFTQRRSHREEEHRKFTEDETNQHEDVNISHDHSLFTSTPDRSHVRRLYRNSEESFLVEPPGGNHTPRRCGSLTRTGQRCKLFCRRGKTSCARHENSYNSYFEQSQIDNNH